VEEDGRPMPAGDSTDPSLRPVRWDRQVEVSPPIGGEHLAATIAALADPATRSPRADTCPFFRTIDAAGAPGAPVEMPDPANRCVALGEPAPQSARQQQLVCLTSGHSNCPRYLRGALVATDAVTAPVRRNPSPPVIASLLILIAAAAMSVGFLLVRGGFDLPASATVPSALAVVPGSSASDGPRPTTPPATASPRATPSPTPAVTPAPTEPAPSATAMPSSRATSSPPPAPTPAATALTGTAARYAVLVACPGAPNCWIYTVRPGDNFRSIVNWFGVPYDTVLRMNPQIRDPATIHTGDRIRMPPPTR
jgi:LysM domain-containing protein